MKRFRLMDLFAIAGCVAASLAATAPGASGATPAVAPTTTASPTPSGAPSAVHFIDGIRDTGQFLPDSVVVLRVDNRPVRVREYVESYFNSYAEDRPKSDSAGRVEFMHALIHKDILGQTARAAGYAFGFEERIQLRAFTDRVLSNVLYQRAVADSALPTDAEVRETYDQHRYQTRLRHIQFADRATAERVRLELLRGHIAWKDAVKKYTIATHDAGPNGDLGWKSRMGMTQILARAIYSLRPSEISQVVEDDDGIHLVQCVERRPTMPPSLETIENGIRGDLQRYHVLDRSERLQSMLASQIDFVTDSAAVRWAAGFFVPPRESKQEQGGTNLVFNTTLPEFASMDTARVLARYRGHTYSLGQFTDAYSHIQPLLRPSVSTPEDFAHQVRNFILEPYMAKLALERGLDKDSMAVAQIEAKREQMLVERMYQDSVMSKVLVSPAERRKYYEANKAGYVTYASVRFATFAIQGRGAADSLAARLKAGERAEDILLADSLAGVHRGSIGVRGSNEHGAYYKVLFEELRPGQLTVDGPDKEGKFLVLQVISRDPGRQLSYEEADAYAYESVQNQKAEALLNALIERQSRKHRIEIHPELVMRIKLVDPTL